MRILEIWVAAALGGCVSEIRVTPQEQCSAVGQIADVVSVDLAMPNHDEVHHVTCRVVHTAQETCESKASAAAKRIKDDWNPDLRNKIILVGYGLLIVPGMVLTSAFRDTQATREREAANTFDRMKARCLAVIPAPTPGPTGGQQQQQQPAQADPPSPPLER